MTRNPKTSTMMSWSKRLLLMSCLWVAIPTQAQTIKTTYDIYAEKSKIGMLDVARQHSNQDGVSTTVIDATMQLRAKNLLESYALDTKEHVVIGSQGVIAYRAEFEENGKKSRVEGRLKDDKFLFEIQEGTEAYNFPLPPLGYDPAMMLLVAHTASNSPKDGPIKFLDPDSFEFQNEQQTAIDQETLTVAGNPLLCHVIDFKTPTSNGKRWIAQDALGSFLVKEAGSDKDGPYSVVITSYSRLP